jgi:tetratricopeptide (TPR) repeat protein
VEATAVAATLLRFAGVADPIQQQLSSPALPDKNSGTDSAAYSETLYPFSSFGWSPLHGLETVRYHFIDAPIAELYDLQADPEEKNNLAARQSATVDVLREKLHSIQQKKAPVLSAETSPSALSADALQRLRALGYIAYRSPVSTAPPSSGLADPKSKLEEFNSILSASDAFRAGDFENGKQVLTKLAAEDPKMYIIPFMLGEAAARGERWTDAASEFRKSLDLNPDFEEAMTGLARALYFSGNFADARTWAQNALKRNPQNYRAWYELGIIESKTDKASAVSDYEAALVIQGNFAPLHRELGMLQFHDHNYRDAATHLSKAIELGLSSAELYNFLGICNSQTGKLRISVANYKQALTLDPNLAEAHLNLAYAYQHMHKPAAARPEYESACKLEQKFCKFVPK